MGEWVELDALDGEGRFAAWQARPDSEAKAAIIVIQEIFGVNPGIRRKADDWAAKGYLAIAPDMFWRFAPRFEADPDVKEELRLDSSGRSREMPPYIRRTKENRLLVTVAEPVERDRHTVGIILLTREAREVDTSLFTVRMSILALFGMALGGWMSGKVFDLTGSYAIAFVGGFGFSMLTVLISGSLLLRAHRSQTPVPA